MTSTSSEALFCSVVRLLKSKSQRSRLQEELVSAEFCTVMNSTPVCCPQDTLISAWGLPKCWSLNSYPSGSRWIPLYPSHLKECSAETSPTVPTLTRDFFIVCCVLPLRPWHNALVSGPGISCPFPIGMSSKNHLHSIHRCIFPRKHSRHAVRVCPCANFVNGGGFPRSNMRSESLGGRDGLRSFLHTLTSYPFFTQCLNTLVLWKPALETQGISNLLQCLGIL